MSEETKAIDRAKIIDKIKKCLALSKSANDAEAAAALRQAQKLMRIHKIDEMDVAGEVIINAFVDCREKFSKTKPESLKSVAHLIGTAFGVMIMWSCSPSGRHRITYWGQRGPVMVAIHAHKMVYKTVNEAWDAYAYVMKKSGYKVPRNSKFSFVGAWCHAVKSKVENLAPSRERHEQLKRAAEIQMGMEPGDLGSTPEKEGPVNWDKTAIYHGLQAAKDFNLHIPLTEQENKDAVS